MSIKVLIIGADLSVGGISGYVGTLASLMSAESFELHMTITQDQTKDVFPSLTRMVKHVLPLSYSLPELLPRVKQVRQLIQRERFELLHLHATRAGFLGCLAATGLPVSIIYTGHGWRYAQKSSAVSRLIFKSYERYICRRADAIVFISEYELFLAGRDKMADLSKTTIIHTRIDGHRFTFEDDAVRVETRKHLDIPEDAPVIGMTGRLVHEKNPMAFVRIASRVLSMKPEAYFLWVGDGELRLPVTHLIHQLGLGNRVVITGVRAADEIPRLLQAMDILLCTSLFETMPLSVLEAQASRRAVVMSAYQGFEYVVKPGETGLVFSPNQEEEAASQVVSLLEDRSLYRSVVDAAYRDFCEKHSNPAIMVSQYEDLYTATYLHRVDAARKVEGRKVSRK